MSRFSEAFAAFAWPSMVEEFGETVLYTQAAELPLAAEGISAIVRRNAEPRSDRDAAGPPPIEVRVSKADVPTPLYGRDGADTVQVDGLTYRVAAIIDDTIEGWKLYCTR